MDTKSVHNLAERYGYLPYMIERYFQFLGEDQTILLLEANEKPLTPSIRVNTLKTDNDTLKERLESKGYELESIDWIHDGFKIRNSPRNIGSTHEYLQGYYYIQSVAPMLPALILDPNPRELVIDMCAAPGGKATHLAQIMNNEGNLILIERNKNRIPALEINLRRMGVSNSIVINDDSANLSKLHLKADKILLDAPCTGEGLIRQDSSRKRSKTLKDIDKLSTIQRKLLKTGLNSLNPGGKLLYCTCSIAPEENELVVDDVLKDKSEFTVIKIPKSYGVDGIIDIYDKSLREDIKYSQRLFPHTNDTIGFFVCLIQRNI
ncbi:MAG: RsmB/NOP family class I SAM-dependent RNA methyltransferase [Candidatus Lokiarchaeota archaeon]|nr:RsmB/NOP family class I SAM-dependent RNA methyltransferase [Candidatus Lokiarchaeota archaeon]